MPIPMPIRFRATLAAATAACLAAAGAIALTSGAQASPSPSPVLVSTADWSIERVPGGYRVALALPEPLEVKSAVPVLYADGWLIGTAAESDGGLTLSAVTADPTVLEAHAVTAGWDTDSVPLDQPLPAAAWAAPEPPAAASAAADDVPDPESGGLYGVREALYDFGDQALDAAFIGGVKNEFRGKVYYPPAKTTASPVAILLHGRHGSCGGTGANPARYPCGATQTEIPSYIGYDATGRALASHGYVVVSVSANSVNANDNQLAYDHGATARGQLILDHLDFLAQANAGAVDQLGSILTGKLDLTKVGVMGHSRGGEGAVRAAQLNLTRPAGDRYGIVSLLPLAPVDYARDTIPGIPTMTVLPYCDGDQLTLIGQHYSDDSTAAFHDDVLRSDVLLQGANHNFFNTIWTPGGFAYSTSDDWGSGSTGQGVNSICGGHASVADTSLRLSPAAQEQVGAILMTAWFRLTLGAETAFLPLFDGSGATTASLAALGADFTATASGPASATTMVNSFEEWSATVRPVGNSNTTFCAGMSLDPYWNAKPLCATQLTRGQGPHWTSSRFAWSAESTSALKYSWTSLGSGANAAGLRVDVPASARDVSGRTALTFRAAPGELATAPADLRVTVRDGSGGQASAVTSDYSAALAPQPYNAISGNGSANLHKTIMTSVYIPTADLTGVDLADVRRIDFTPLAANGTAFLSNLAFSDPAVGTPDPDPDLPLLTMGSAYVNEGNGPGTALVPIWIDRPTDQPVTGSFEITANYLTSGSAPTGATPTGQATVMEPFRIAPGQICTVAHAPIDGNVTTSAAVTAVYPVTATAVRNAATASSFGTLTIREDDAVVTAGGEVLDLAPPPTETGDPCGDPLPDPTPTPTPTGEPEPLPTVTVTATAEPQPGPTVTVTADPGPAPTVTATATATATVTPEPAPGVTVTGAPVPGPTVTVTATPAAGVLKPFVKAAAKVTAKLAKKSVARGAKAKVKLRVTVTAAGKPAAGKVAITIDGKRVKTAALKKGKAVITLPKAKVAKLKSGKHKVAASYLGSAAAKPAKKSAGALKVVARS
jgi:hypothetical protein